jgi:3-oxoacyl-[acyl-carrier-protein] synthase II
VDTPLVITGLGLTTSLGIGVEANWTALRAGETGLRPLTSIDVADHPVTDGGEAPLIPGANPNDDRRDRAHAYLTAAIREALTSAGIDGRVPDPERTSLLLGSSLAAQASAPVFWASFLEKGPRDADFSALRSYDAETRLASLCADLDVRGEAFLVSNACAAGGSALAAAADLIRLGRTDMAIVAGYDALDLHTFAGFGGIKALTATHLKCFGPERDGMLLGDGFAVMILERARSAKVAGRAPMGHLLGYGESSDAHHLTQPHPEGLGAALAMKRALRCAGLEPGEISTINAHSTSTPSNDAAEFRAMRTVFGERIATLPVVASKPAVGHTLGGAGVVEAAITLLALREQCLTPTVGAGDIDEACAPMDLVSEARPAGSHPFVRGMSNSFGFGGCNASIILGRDPAGAAGSLSTDRVRFSVPAITGLGVACPLGVGHEAFWQQLIALDPAVCDSPPSADGLDVRPATAFAEEFPAEDYVNPRRVRKCSAQARLAIVASQLAAQDAGLPEDAALRESTGVILGTCFGSADYYLKFHAGIQKRGLKAANAVLFTEGVFNAAPGHVSKLLGTRGPGLALVGGEDAGLSALVTAVDRLRLGTVDAALAGGVDAYSDLVQASLRSEGRIGEAIGEPLSEEPSLLAEGAAVVCVEPLDMAQARGATVYARVLGVARARAGSGGPEDPTPLVRAAERALANAALGPMDLDLVIGGACGGPAAARERAALETLLGSSPCRVRWPKALVGEGFAFTSALQAIVGALAIAKNVVPETYGDESRDPKCSVKTVLVLAASRPGGAVAVVLSK